ncbi:hypothetical protein AAFF_G00007160 [Aldrovandia affinis]|uniref:Uncharacterized protein n=1 Tax=Aldrovandia affinis TaxID=143900 RepID=A0AAD7WZU8_9TELE|nr:hypothetical protein AAFF_G00007160 [Aldrovandia affinis]
MKAASPPLTSGTRKCAEQVMRCRVPPCCHRRQTSGEDPHDGPRRGREPSTLSSHVKTEDGRGQDLLDSPLHHLKCHTTWDIQLSGCNRSRPQTGPSMHLQPTVSLTLRRDEVQG